MRPLTKLGIIVCAATLLVNFCARGALGRQRPPGAEPPEEVLRVDAELVQTGVSVFDRQGRFVDGLGRDDFELRVDGRPVPIAFFENVVAGGARDVLARASAEARPGAAAAGAAAPEPTLRRRTVVFFLDDLHLSLDSLNRARKMLLDFIENGAGPDDLVAVASSSGRVGFLQQFTDNKDVLRAAVARLGHVPYVVADYGRNPGTPMTEYMALTIERRDDPSVFSFYVQDCMKYAPVGGDTRQRAGMREQCEVEVRNRARQILIQAGAVTAGTYYSLETLLRSARKMPGSKLAFFVSDGFLAETGPRGSISRDRLARITDEARRAGVVIYTVDARGLVSGALDATGNVPFDADGRLESANAREMAASQDALDALAADTGGRALRNQPYFDRFVGDALAETSRYYLIAWRPEGGGRGEKLRRIEVRVAGRPELTVRSARGFFGGAGAAVSGEGARAEAKGRAPKEKGPGAELREALSDFYPRRELPVQLSLTYLDTPASGGVLTTSVQASAETLSYGDEGGEPARLTLAGVVLDDRGKPAASFGTTLKVSPPRPGGGAAPDSSGVIYNNPAPLKPGLYQVRVAARDDRSGLVGSAMQWAVIPDLSAGKLSLSSLILGLESVSGAGAEAGRMQWSVEKSFARGSRLGLLCFVYNAARAADLAARAEVFRDGRPVTATPSRRLAAGAGADPARVPFTAEIGLGELRPGRYTLRVTVEDRAGGRAAAQQATFYVR